MYLFHGTSRRFNSGNRGSCAQATPSPPISQDVITKQPLHLHAKNQSNGKHYSAAPVASRVGHVHSSCSNHSPHERSKAGSENGQIEFEIRFSEVYGSSDGQRAIISPTDAHARTHCQENKQGSLEIHHGAVGRTGFQYYNCALSDFLRVF